MFTYPLTFRFSLCVKQRNGEFSRVAWTWNMALQHRGLQTGHAGAGTSKHRYLLLQRTFHLASLSLAQEYIFSVTRKSLTALIQAETIHNSRLHYTCDHGSCIDVRPTSLVVWRGCGFARLGLRHWIVASRGCDSIASFSCHSKATSPSVYWCRVFYWPSHD